MTWRCRYFLMVFPVNKSQINLFSAIWKIGIVPEVTLNLLFLNLVWHFLLQRKVYSVPFFRKTWKKHFWNERLIIIENFSSLCIQISYLHELSVYATRQRFAKKELLFFNNLKIIIWVSSWELDTSRTLKMLLKR